MAHTIGHVAATVSMSKVAVSFTHIIKSGEPAFSVLVSRFLLGESFPAQVYLSLVPIIGGCALAAVTELNFNMIGKKKLHCLAISQLLEFSVLYSVDDDISPVSFFFFWSADIFWHCEWLLRKGTRR